MSSTFQSFLAAAEEASVCPDVARDRDPVSKNKRMTEALQEVKKSLDQMWESQCESIPQTAQKLAEKCRNRMFTVLAHACQRENRVANKNTIKRRGGFP